MKAVRGLDTATPGLSRYRELEPSSRDWNDFKDGFELGRAYKALIGELAARQRGLCAYCEIGLTDMDREVEHFHPKSDTISETNWTFEPTNLFAACKGGTNPNSKDPARRALRPSKLSCSCGAFKGDKILDGTDPQRPPILKPTELSAFPRLFEIIEDGGIRPDPAACTHARVSVTVAEATIAELNLNCKRLKNIRKSVWDELFLVTQAAGDADDSAYNDALESWAETYLLPDPDGRLRGFFTTARSFFGDIGERVLCRSADDWL